MTTETHRSSTTPEIGGMGHSVKRKEDPRFIRGQGEYIDDVNLPGQLWLDIVRSPYAHATIKGIDATEALKIPGVARRHHRRGPREGRPALDADPRRRQADGAADRHGHVPGPGGRRGRRHDHATSPPTASPRSSSTTSRCRSSSTRTRRSSRTRSSSAPTAARTSRTTTSGTGSRATRPPTDAALAAAEVRVERGHLHPAHPRRLDRDVRLRRRLGRRSAAS